MGQVTVRLPPKRLPKEPNANPSHSSKSFSSWLDAPFQESKHQAPCQRQVHLGLLNDFIEFQNGSCR